MPRREFSRKTRRLAWERANEMCEGMVLLIDGRQRCCAPLMFGRFEYDHGTPDWMGGDNSLQNCILLCLRCHEEKTARDQGNIAKVKRIRDKQIKAKTPRRRIRGGKRFDGSPIRYD